VDGFIGLMQEPVLKEWLKKNSEDENEKIEKLIYQYQEVAKKKGLKLNPNKELANNLIKGLLANEKKYGVRYCPCRRVAGKKEEDDAKICPCSFLDKEIEEKGQCLCGLFVK